MDEVKKRARTDKISVPQDRVTLTPAISKRVNGWLDQLNEKFNGLIELNRSDLTNYFLDQISDLLNRDQIEKIKTAHYDEVRFMSWALQKMKESKKNGETLSLSDLMQLSQTRVSHDVKRAKRAKSAESKGTSTQNEPNDPEKMHTDLV